MGSKPWALTKGKNMGTVIIIIPAGSSTMARRNMMICIKMMVPQGPPGIYVIISSIRWGAPIP